MKRRKNESPRSGKPQAYRVVINHVAIDSEEYELRMRRAFDVLFEEALRNRQTSTDSAGTNGSGGPRQSNKRVDKSPGSILE
jgi:hypothetical protein